MAQGGLTTHVLDTTRGRPAAGLRVELYRLGADGARVLLAREITNADGRTDTPLVAAGSLQPGRYELLFHAGAYLDAIEAAGPVPRFLDEVPVRFGISDPTAHHHVPLLLSAHGYSTYRGS